MTNHLLPPNATPQERAVSETLSRADTLNVPIRALWRPQQCPAHLLPWLAWALSVDEWDERWSDEKKRAAIAASINVHRHKGTVGAMKRALKPYGNATLSEWFHYGGEPYRFRVDININDRPVDNALYRDVERAIHRVKNARSWLDSLAIALTSEAAAPRIASAIHATERFTLYPYQRETLSQTTPLPRMAHALHGGVVTTLYPEPLA